MQILNKSSRVPDEQRPWLKSLCSHSRHQPRQSDTPSFSKDDTSDNPWHQKSDYILRNKVTFDFHQTNPQMDIQPTGHCEYWVYEVCLMDHIDQNAGPHE